MFSFRIFDVRMPDDIAERLALIEQVDPRPIAEIVGDACRAGVDQVFREHLAKLPADRQALFLERIDQAERLAQKARTDAVERVSFEEQFRRDEALRNAPKPRPIAERLEERSRKLLADFRKSAAQANWIYQEISRILGQLAQPGVLERIRYDDLEHAYERDVRGILGVNGHSPLTSEQLGQVVASFGFMGATAAKIAPQTLQLVGV